MSNRTEPEVFETENDLPDLMERAATVLEERGWLQGDFFDLETAFVRNQPVEKCAVCVRGALNIAAGFDPTGPDEEDDTDGRQDAVDALAFFLGYDAERTPDGEDTAWFVTHWNDWRAKSADEVTAALRACAAELSKENA